MLTLLSLSIVPAVLAAPLPVDLAVDWIKIDGDEVNPGDSLTFERGEEVPIRIRLTASSDVEDVQVTVGIFGYEYTEFESNKVIQTDLVDLKAGKTDTLEFDLTVPVRMEADEDQDTQLQIFIADRYGTPLTYQYNLFVEGVDDRDAVIIKEAYLSPSSQVLAGRAVSALVRVENIGRDDLEDGVTLIVSVPELGIQDTETLDELDTDEVETFEKIILRFPKDTAAGNYLVEYQVRYDNYYSSTATGIVNVLEDPNAGSSSSNGGADEPTTFITVPNAQSATAGGNGAVYPIVISNTDDSAKTYSVSVSGVDSWGSARVDQGATLVVGAGQSQTAFVFVNANEDAAAGEKVFTVTVSSEGEQKVIPLSVNVAEGDSKSSKGLGGLSRVLEVGVIILIVILILIALIVGFNKLRGNDDDDDDSKTYY